MAGLVPNFRQGGGGRCYGRQDSVGRASVMLEEEIEFLFTNQDWQVALDVELCDDTDDQHSTRTS